MSKQITIRDKRSNSAFLIGVKAVGRFVIELSKSWKSERAVPRARFEGRMFRGDDALEAREVVALEGRARIASRKAWAIATIRAAESGVLTGSGTEGGTVLPESKNIREAPKMNQPKQPSATEA